MIVSLNDTDVENQIDIILIKEANHYTSIANFVFLY
jgi:hypothetical protein